MLHPPTSDLNDEGGTLSVSSNPSDIQGRRSVGETPIAEQKNNEEDNPANLKQNTLRNDIQNFQRNHPRQTRGGFTHGNGTNLSAGTNNDNRSVPLQRITEMVKSTGENTQQADEPVTPGAYQMQGRAVGGIPAWIRRNRQGRSNRSNRNTFLARFSIRSSARASRTGNTNNEPSQVNLPPVPTVVNKVITADVEALSIDADEKNEAKVSPNKSIIISSSILAIIILAIGLGVGLTLRYWPK